MNHIGTHDTERAITKIAGEKSDYRDRQWQSEHFLSEEEYKRGVKLLKLCAAISVYPSPECRASTTATKSACRVYKDPFNRAFFPWGKRKTASFKNYYIRLGKGEKKHRLLKRKASFIPCFLGCSPASASSVAVKNDSCLLIANRNEQDITYYLPPRWQNTSEVLLGESVGSSVLVPGLSAVILKKKLLDKSAYCGAGACRCRDICYFKDYFERFLLFAYGHSRRVLEGRLGFFRAGSFRVMC